MAQKTMVVLQSSYIPWKGFFDLIRHSDEFVIYDDAQFTRRDWRNRNLIKTAAGPQWISIPVEVKGKFNQKIKDTKIAAPDWQIQHFKTIQHAYARAPFFKFYSEQIENLYRTATSTYLSEVNYHFMSGICAILDIKANFRWSSEFKLAEDRNVRLASICQQAGATRYVSGPSAKAYLDESIFHSLGISVDYFSYSDYPEYPQLHGQFCHEVSIIDLLLNVGPDALNFLKKIPCREF